MTTTRRIRQISSSVSTLEGAGVHLRRAFGFTAPEQYDPFLLFDDFRSDSPELYRKGFPWHPHRGIETITYVLKGEVAHGDSLGNKGVIAGGDAQWMTAGSGIIHQEMPEGDANGAMHGFQLWLNLPAAEKMCEPAYRDITAADIPVLDLKDGGTIRIICGAAGGLTGPVHNISTDPEYFDVTLAAGSLWEHNTREDYTVVVYVIDGAGTFAPDSTGEAHNRTLLLYGPGDKIAIKAGGNGVRFLFMSGKPLHEPIAWRGPIVMNTEEELATAFREFATDKFLRHDPKHIE